MISKEQNNENKKGEEVSGVSKDQLEQIEKTGSITPKGS